MAHTEIEVQLRSQYPVPGSEDEQLIYCKLLLALLPELDRYLPECFSERRQLELKAVANYLLRKAYESEGYDCMTEVITEYNFATHVCSLFVERDGEQLGLLELAGI